MKESKYQIKLCQFLGALFFLQIKKRRRKEPAVRKLLCKMEIQQKKSRRWAKREKGKKFLTTYATMLDKKCIPFINGCLERLIFFVYFPKKLKGRDFSKRSTKNCTRRQFDSIFFYFLRSDNKSSSIPYRRIRTLFGLPSKSREKHLIISTLYI